MTAIATTTAGPDFDAIKQRQQATWAAGDYATVGVTLQIVGERLCEALDLRAGERVLDVAAGNGNATLAAARRFCDVTSTDYVDTLLDHGRERAAAERLDVCFRNADAEALPFEHDGFDAVVSTFGVMFTPRQETAASELVRVCRPGGRIGLANWTPEGFVGQIFKTIGGFVAPPAGISSPALWGTRERLDELFGHAASTLETTLRTYAFRYRSPEQWVDLWREIYGPMRKAFDALDETGQAELRRALLDLVARENRSRDGTMVVHGSYLEVVVTRRGALS